jgi:hypothetical protein
MCESIDQDFGCDFDQVCESPLRSSGVELMTKLFDTLAVVALLVLAPHTASCVVEEQRAEHSWHSETEFFEWK